MPENLNIYLNVAYREARNKEKSLMSHSVRAERISYLFTAIQTHKHTHVEASAPLSLNGECSVYDVVMLKHISTNLSKWNLPSTSDGFRWKHWRFMFPLLSPRGFHLPKVNWIFLLFRKFSISLPSTASCFSEALVVTRFCFSLKLDQNVDVTNENTSRFN